MSTDTSQSSIRTPTGRTCIIGTTENSAPLRRRFVAGGPLAATKRVLAMQLAAEMEHQHISKAQMARRMHTSRSSLERLLDPENESVTLQTLDKAARSLGRRTAVVLI